MHKTLRLWIEEAETICVFRHQNPDPDALGSQWGLVTWLKETYPEKNVYALGKHIGVKPELFGIPDDVSDETVEGSLAIVLDTANAARIDDQRFAKAKRIVKIDHHPQPDPYAHLEIVNAKAASTCEIIAGMLKTFCHDKPLSKGTAQFLYMGILTDTIKFSTTNTTPHTLKIAAYLAESDLDLPTINEDLFAVSKKEFDFINYLRRNATIEPSGLVYIRLTSEILLSMDVTPNQAKEMIAELGNVREFEIWCLFIETLENPGVFNGSLRSRHKIVNDIAARYGGGGHQHAAAVKAVDRSRIEQLFAELRLRIKGEL